jgi:hypothetical protein
MNIVRRQPVSNKAAGGPVQAEELRFFHLTLLANEAFSAVFALSVVRGWIRAGAQVQQ